MAHIFISHAEEDSHVATELAELLKEGGYATWHYERDSRLGQSYLEQVARAVEEAGAVVLIISRDAFRSQHVDREVTRALDYKRPFIPLLRRLSHEEFKNEKPAWSFAIGATVSLPIPRRGVSAIVPEVVSYLERLGVGKASDKPPPPETWWKRWRRKIARRPARLKSAVAALCALAAVMLLLKMFWPSLLISKSGGTLEANYTGEKFEYSFDIEITNYDFWSNVIADIDATIETSALPPTDPNRSSGVCHYDGTNREVGLPYIAKPFSNTVKMRCSVIIVPDDGEVEALKQLEVMQQLTLVFSGRNNVPYPHSLKFCFRRTSDWPVTTQVREDC